MSGDSGGTGSGRGGKKGAGFGGDPDAPGAKAGRIGAHQRGLGIGTGTGGGGFQSRAEKKESFASIAEQAQTPEALAEKTGAVPSAFGGYKRSKAAGYVTAEEAEALGPQASLGIAAREAGLDVSVGEQGEVSFAPSGFDASRAVGALLGEEYGLTPSQFAGVPKEARTAVAAGLKEGTLKAGPEGVARSPVGRAAEVASTAYSGFSTVASLGTLAAADALTSVAGLAGVAPDVASLTGSIKSIADLAEREATLVGAGVLGPLSKPKSATRSPGEFGALASVRKPKPTAAGGSLPKDPEVPTPRTTAARTARRPRTRTVFTGITGIA